jgi:hypothetical protein
MADNATNNDTMIESISAGLTLDGVEYEPKAHRLRCNGHIINLSVQAFLFEAHPNAFGDTKNTDENPTEEDLVRWRKIGPLGKVHNLVKYILASP